MVLELKRSKLDKVLRSDIARFKMFAEVYEPIVSVCGLDTVAEGLRLVCEELFEGSKLSLIVSTCGFRGIGNLCIGVGTRS